MRGESECVVNDKQDGGKSMDDGTRAYSIVVQYKKSPSGSKANKRQEKGESGWRCPRARRRSRSEQVAVALMLHDGAARALKQN